MKKKLDRKNFMFVGLADATLVKRPGDINGNSFLVEGLNNCQVFLCDRLAALYIDNCTNCTISTGPICGALFVRGCKNTQVRTASQQLRISNSRDIKACVFSETPTTLEDTKGLILGPYNFSYPGIQAHFSQSELNVKLNRCFQVLDFTPSAESFGVMGADEFASDRAGFTFVEDSLVLQETGEGCPVPLPCHFGGEVALDVFQHDPNQDPQEDPTMSSFKMGKDMATAESESRRVQSTEVSLKPPKGPE